MQQARWGRAGGGWGQVGVRASGAAGLAGQGRWGRAGGAAGLAGQGRWGSREGGAGHVWGCGAAGEVGHGMCCYRCCCPPPTTSAAPAHHTPPPLPTHPQHLQLLPLVALAPQPRCCTRQGPLCQLQAHCLELRGALCSRQQGEGRGVRVKGGAGPGRSGERGPAASVMYVGQSQGCWAVSRRCFEAQQRWAGHQHTSCRSCVGRGVAAAVLPGQSWCMPCASC